jgi:catechol 2,3-dioxygenase-like lactoylglutathione lyase family enzyme
MFSGGHPGAGLCKASGHLAAAAADAELFNRHTRRLAHPDVTDPARRAAVPAPRPYGREETVRAAWLVAELVRYSPTRMRHDGGVTGIGTLECVVFDGPDIDAAAAFYTALTGWSIGHKEPDRITLQTPAGPYVALQRASDHIAPRWPGQEYPQQFHLDLDVNEPAEAAERAIALGGTRLAEGPYWVTLADPAGHPFDLCEAGNVTPMSRLWVSIDAPDASALARFYGALLGMDVAHDAPEGAAITGDGTTVFFQPVTGYTAPRWPDPAFPQQAHLDVLVDDLDVSETRAVEMGASRLGGGDAFRVLADPAGHPFCCYRLADDFPQPLREHRLRRLVDLSCRDDDDPADG